MATGGEEIINMKSIKVRLVINFMLIIAITVAILEMMLIFVVKENYYNNLEENMTNQLRISTDLYNRYFSDVSLETNVLNNVDTFWRQSTCQVEIASSTGEIIMDSIGVIPGDNVISTDIKEALEGKKGRWVGKAGYSGEWVMAVSYPLKSGENIVGVLRFISSLREVNKNIREISYIFLGIGTLVGIISAMISLFFSRTIVVPINEATRAAEKMARGNFGARSRKVRDDEIGKLSDTLNYMADEIIKKDQLKNDFISSVSHELRTPLTSIKGWAVTLQNERFQTRDTLNDGLKIIEKESDRLTSMVEELLDFSKFVSGKITIKKEWINPVEIMEHIKKQLSPRAERENLDFQVEVDDNIPMLLGDENRMKQLFINLIDNAFNFTASGGKVLFSAEAKEDEILFNVVDTGCGIPEDEIPKVREKFYKGKSSKSKNGIGLSICDEIVRMHDGRLEIYSKVNEGTRVTAVFPLSTK